MPFIAKTAPFAADPGDSVQIAEKPFYGGGDIRAGAEVFFWSSETQGGVGLWARGTVTAVKSGGAKSVVTARIDQRTDSGSFGLTEIAPHRDSRADTPIVGLARKLYKHAHNKVASVSVDEAALLRRFFG